MPNPCPYCGDHMANVRRKQCGKPECKRAFKAERMRDWQRAYHEEHGQWYARHRHGEAQRAYSQQHRQRLGHWRQRYPAQAAAADARRRMRMEQARTAETFTPREVHMRDQWTCQLCRQPIDPEVAWPDPMSASVDHIVPLSRGGQHSLINVQSAHLGCNSSKGDRIEVDQSESISIP
jgi:5-methylcytosine-specific restriction endonuclease McrA